MRALFLTIAALGVMIATTLLVTGHWQSSDRLTGVSWEWTASVAGEAAAPSPVADPSRYTIEFGSERTFLAQADCNDLSGRFRRIPPGRRGPFYSLTLLPAQGALVACGPGSLAEEYVRGLAAAVGYAIVDGGLAMRLADGSSMTFRSRS